jgi:hypothetical protein
MGADHRYIPLLVTDDREERSEHAGRVPELL